MGEILLTAVSHLIELNGLFFQLSVCVVYLRKGFMLTAITQLVDQLFACFIASRIEIRVIRLSVFFYLFQPCGQPEPMPERIIDGPESNIGNVDTQPDSDSNTHRHTRRRENGRNHGADQYGQCGDNVVALVTQHSPFHAVSKIFDTDLGEKSVIRSQLFNMFAVFALNKMRGMARSLQERLFRGYAATGCRQPVQQPLLLLHRQHQVISHLLFKCQHALQ